MIVISVVVGVYMCRYVGICNVVAMCDYDICSCGYVYIHVKSIAMCIVTYVDLCVPCVYDVSNCDHTMCNICNCVYVGCV